MSMMSPADESRTFHELCVIAREIAVGTRPEDDPITLASGKKSNYYVNARVLMGDPNGLRLAGRLLWRRARYLHGNFVGGMETGAIAISTALLHNVAGMQRNTLRGFYVRKKPKDHGNTGRVEGLKKGVTLKDRKVIVVEDTTTTGGSLLDAVQAVREEGAIVHDVLTLFDREEGGQQACHNANLHFHSVIPVRTHAHLLFPAGFEPKIWD